mmetsp:Transcript_4775/g.11982  ORF Transcript_4775/g.11982 Transcript_4775/m.11982 type:complete len:261 (+) Transcript_4775:863-1645(+)
MCLWASARVEQQLHQARVAVLHGDAKRCQPGGIRCVQCCTGGHERGHHCSMPLPDRKRQRGAARRREVLQSRPARDQRLDDGQVALQASQRKRGVTLDSHHIRGGAGSQQLRREVGVAEPGGQAEGDPCAQGGAGKEPVHGRRVWQVRGCPPQDRLLHRDLGSEGRLPIAGISATSSVVIHCRSRHTNGASSSSQPGRQRSRWLLRELAPGNHRSHEASSPGVCCETEVHFLLGSSLDSRHGSHSATIRKLGTQQAPATG